MSECVSRPRGEQQVGSSLIQGKSEWKVTSPLALYLTSILRSCLTIYYISNITEMLDIMRLSAEVRVMIFEYYIALVSHVCRATWHQLANRVLGYRSLMIVLLVMVTYIKSHERQILLATSSMQYDWIVSYSPNFARSSTITRIGLSVLYAMASTAKQRSSPWRGSSQEIQCL